MNATVGSDLVELAAQTETFAPREIGELRSIAAELKREGFADTPRDPSIRDPAAGNSDDLNNGHVQTPEAQQDSN